MPRGKALGIVVAIFAILASAPFSVLHAQQKLDSFNQERVRGILHDAYDSVKKHYYDPKFHGIDWDARYHEFDEKIKNVGSINEGFVTVAGFLDALNDSHTFFEPPSRPFRLDYGFRMQVVGDDCFIVRVRPGTDAEQKVHPGDQILTYNSFNVAREDAWKAEYLFGALVPQEVSHLTVQTPEGQKQDLELKSKVQQQKKVADLTESGGGFDIRQMILDEQDSDHANRHRWTEFGDVMIWKMPEFDLDDSEVDRIFGIARKHKTLILDLRNNPGGSVLTLERMVGNVMDHDVKIADRVGRRDLKPMLTKTRGGHAFSGALIVLMDSKSASAAELFSRVVQLEHRGTVLGDHTAGGRNGGARIHFLAGPGHQDILFFLHYRRRPHHGRRKKPGTRWRRTE
jgi:C-terminal processing protease CtpA/Prc